MIFRAYLDEANTSVREPDMTVAGFLGTARQRRAVERELWTNKRRMRFQSFHGVEFKGPPWRLCRMVQRAEPGARQCAGPRRLRGTY